MKALIIDDTVDLTNVIQKILINQKYEVDCAYDGKTGLRKALSGEYDIILLDIMIPQMNGYEVLKTLRKEGRETPVILITAKDGITDKIDGLDLGADDYMQKPFNMSELIARIRAVTRRNLKSDANQEIYYSDIILNPVVPELSREQTKISLSANEGEIMKYLIQKSEIIVPPEKLMEVCSLPSDAGTVISKAIERLQNILAYLGSRVTVIFIKGVGYKLCY